MIISSFTKNFKFFINFFVINLYLKHHSIFDTPRLKSLAVLIEYRHIRVVLADDAAVMQYRLALLDTEAPRYAGQDLDIKASAVHIDADLALTASDTVDLGALGVDLGVSILELDLAR